MTLGAWAYLKAAQVQVAHAARLPEGLALDAVSLEVRRAEPLHLAQPLGTVGFGVRTRDTFSSFTNQ